MDRSPIRHSGTHHLRLSLSRGLARLVRGRHDVSDRAHRHGGQYRYLRRRALPPLRRTRSRCQRRTVSGVTSTTALRQGTVVLWATVLSAATMSARGTFSHQARRGGGSGRRCRMASWWRSARISRSLAAAERHPAVSSVRRRLNRRASRNESTGYTPLRSARRNRLRIPWPTESVDHRLGGFAHPTVDSTPQAGEGDTCDEKALSEKVENDHRSQDHDVTGHQLCPSRTVYPEEIILAKH